MTAADLIRALQDGYTLVRPITYDDKPPKYYLKKYPSRDTENERVSRIIVESVINRPEIKHHRTSNWDKWNWSKTP